MNIKTSKKWEIEVPKESVLEWLHGKFPELPKGARVTGTFLPVFSETVRFTLEHGLEVSATPAKVTDGAAEIITLPEGDA